MKKFKSNKIIILSKEEATQLKKPKYNAYAYGHGTYGSKKYDGNKIKRTSLDQF